MRPSHSLKPYLYFTIVFLHVSCTYSGRTGDKVTDSNSSDSVEHAKASVAKDSIAMVKSTLNFLHWYGENMIRLSRIMLVDQKPGTNYSVNTDSCDKYLHELRLSGFFTPGYLQEKRKEFEDKKKELEKNPQNEGPPYRFEADQVMLTQDIDSELDSIPRFKVVSSSYSNDTGFIDFTLYYEYEFMLVKQDHEWMINRILLVGDE